jgi:hypothetical protein
MALTLENKIMFTLFFFALIFNSCFSKSLLKSKIKQFSLEDIEKFVFNEYSSRVKSDVNRIYEENNWNEENITFQEFYAETLKFNYCLVAKELCSEEKIERHYKKNLNKRGKLPKSNYEKYYAGIWFEGELLVSETHPVQSFFIKNTNNVNNKEIDTLAKEYHKICLREVDRMFVQHNVMEGDKIDLKKFTEIIASTDLWKFLAEKGTPLDFLDKIAAKNFLVYNTVGSGQSLNKAEFKVFFFDYFFHQVDTLGLY